MPAARVLVSTIANAASAPPASGTMASATALVSAAPFGTWATSRMASPRASPSDHPEQRLPDAHPVQRERPAGRTAEGSRGSSSTADPGMLKQRRATTVEAQPDDARGSLQKAIAFLGDRFHTLP